MVKLVQSWFTGIPKPSKVRCLDEVSMFYRMSENEVYPIIIYEIPRSIEGNMVSDNHPSEFYSSMFLPVLSGRCRVGADNYKTNFEGSR